jgi:hypothetical protein
MLIRKGFVDSDRAWDYVKSFDADMQYETWNGEINKSLRKCFWFGVGVSLGNVNLPFKSRPIPVSLKKKGVQLYGDDSFNSVLLYKYSSGTELKLHCDRACFSPKVVLINLCDDDFLGYGTKFLYDCETHNLNNGEIIEFNSQVPHGVAPVDSERWSISFRQVYGF